MKNYHLCKKLLVPRVLTEKDKKKIQIPAYKKSK